MSVPFDEAASAYDRDFSHTAVGRAQRAAVHAYLDTRVLPESGTLSVLDLGCGTGEDVLFLAGKGHRVVALDRSQNMLDIARAKVAERGLDALVSWRRFDLGAHRTLDFNAPFDLVVSDFGVLNCLAPDDVRALATAAATWVRRGGRMILVVMPRLCLWETLYFTVRGPRGEAFRRTRPGPVEAHITGATVPVWYHPAAAVRDAFAPAFEPIAVRPVGVAVPPSLLAAFCDRHRHVFTVLRWLEGALQQVPWCTGIADHYLLDLCRGGARLVGRCKPRRLLAVVSQTAPVGARRVPLGRHAR